MTKNILAIFIVILTLFEYSNAKILSDSKIQGRLNILNGYASECVMHEFYTNTGWIQIEGEIGRNGIDGLYYKKKNEVINELLVAESKWNSSRLGKSGKNKLTKQMSQKWILRILDRLQKYKPLAEYKKITKLIMSNQYRARLFKLMPRGKDKIQILIYKIKNKGHNEFDTFIESELKPITLSVGKNNFESSVISSYNQCRSDALHKYFPTLDESSIYTLLKDNYLQKSDIKKYLKSM